MMDMENISQKQKVILSIVAIFVFLVVAGYYFYTKSQKDMGYNFSNKNPESVEEETAYSDTIFVEILGYVNNPGIYELEEGIMVLELIELAGGLRNDANMAYLHKDLSLSAVVEDQQKIYIPEQSLQELANSSNPAGSQGLISINNASEAELDTLPGIGPATAQKIIAGRPYAELTDLQDVAGIGESTYTKIVSLITL